MERLEIPIHRALADRLTHLKEDTGLSKAKICRRAIKYYLDIHEKVLRDIYSEEREVVDND